MNKKTYLLLTGSLLALKASLMFANGDKIQFPEPEFPPIIVDPGPPIQAPQPPKPNPDDFPKPPGTEEN